MVKRTLVELTGGASSPYKNYPDWPYVYFSDPRHKAPADGHYGLLVTAPHYDSAWEGFVVETRLPLLQEAGFLKYRFDTDTTSSEPTAGYIKVNNGTQFSATTLRASILDNSTTLGVFREPELANIALRSEDVDGLPVHLYVYAMLPNGAHNPGKFMGFHVTAHSLVGGQMVYTLSPRVHAGGAFAVDEPVLVGRYFMTTDDLGGGPKQIQVGPGTWGGPIFGGVTFPTPSNVFGSEGNIMPMVLGNILGGHLQWRIIELFGTGPPALLFFSGLSVQGELGEFISPLSDLAGGASPWHIIGPTDWYDAPFYDCAQAGSTNPIPDKPGWQNVLPVFGAGGNISLLSAFVNGGTLEYQWIEDPERIAGPILTGCAKKKGVPAPDVEAFATVVEPPDTGAGLYFFLETDSCSRPSLDSIDSPPGSVPASALAAGWPFNNDIGQPTFANPGFYGVTNPPSGPPYLALEEAPRPGFPFDPYVWICEFSGDMRIDGLTRGAAIKSTYGLAQT